MKGITYLIIASVVWSIVSSIIEKRKAAAKKAASQRKTGTTIQPMAQEVEPVSVKVQSLRSRAKKRPPTPAQSPPEPVAVTQKRKTKRLEPLHKEDCPLPPLKEAKAPSIPAKQIAKLLKNRRNLRTAMVLTEILGKPISQR
jgi:hypothetical protein